MSDGSHAFAMDQLDTIYESPLKRKKNNRPKWFENHDYDIIVELAGFEKKTVERNSEKKNVRNATKSCTRI